MGSGRVRRARQAAADLGLTALDLPPSRSGYDIGLLYRPETLGDPVGHSTDLSAEVTHGCCVGLGRGPAGTARAEGRALVPILHAEAASRTVILVRPCS